MESDGWITESYFSLIPEDGLLMTLGQADERMSEPTLHDFFVMVCKLRDRVDGDVVGVATELEERHPDPATEGMITRTEWSIFLPGKGTCTSTRSRTRAGFNVTSSIRRVARVRRGPVDGK